MARIKITDIPKDQTITWEDMKGLRGGQNYNAYTLNNLVVQSYHYDGTSDDRPFENITF